MRDLPVESIFPSLREALASHSRVVLQAPPGAGKTTRVPLALVDEPWLAGRRIVMLEPRRIATRGAARWMAETLGERIGETVGYRVRMDSQVGPRTRIEVVTEGVLTRMLQSDSALEGVGLLIFDEFHERNLNADVGLALALQSQELIRDDLRILVMSATLDSVTVAGLLGGAPVLTSEGRSYPVEVRYTGRRPETRVESAVVSAIRDAVMCETGDLLVFLPGAGEIRRVQQMVEEGGLPLNVYVAPLYGSLPPAEQEQAIAPSQAGRRKIVLSTSIAETSITIDGVRVVIDSGVTRVPKFSPRSGMTRLETVRVSRAAADQRCGRAGRVGPGICYRLWTEQEQHQLVPHRTPEIIEADLAPLALELGVAGIADPCELHWLDAPPPGSYAQARELLGHLGALDASGRVTAHGQRMAELGMHPRLAHMVLAGSRLGHGVVACHLAALLEERDILYAEGGVADADIRLRLEAVLQSERRQEKSSELFQRYRVDRQACRRIVEEARRWQRQLRVRAEAPIDVNVCGVLLAFAYPDRIAQRRSGPPGRFLLRNGRGVVLADAQPLSNAPYLVVAELDGKLPGSRIFLAADVSLADLETHIDEEIETQTTITWNDETRSVQARVQERLGVLVLKDGTVREPDPEQVAAVLLEAIRRMGSSALPWSETARSVQARMRFMHERNPAWPDVSEEALLATLETWLAPYIAGIHTLHGVQRLDLTETLLGMLSWEQRTALDERAPTYYVVPSGSRIAIDYSVVETPILAVRLQEMFGLQETPRIDHGTVPLTLHLLSPARRPVQVTRDLAGFWKTSYFDVRKDLRGRYPKHAWPEDPLRAMPTSRAKPRA